MISRISKRRLGLNRFLTTRKLFLGIVLVVLFWSRILSSYNTVAQTESSFSTEIPQSNVDKPFTEDQSTFATAHAEKQSELTAVTSEELIQMRERSAKAERIRNFYARWNSPMAAYAEYIVEIADQYGIDWRLIPAISIVESSGGTKCFKSYNAFGWGQMSFNNFEESIYTVTRGIAQGYGTSDPYAIAPKYNPVTPDSWGSKVSSLMAQI
ncbi:glucosaminidase domain-containing protein [Candidatus Dojkabacteria bacterium]|nr:glucosaminidase domain-containing protein [Candidatus Dojkabacteria bacterium]